MKLTVELIARTDSFLNPLKDRELDLRGLKIPAIENLGATKDSIDALDLSDNAILSLSNLPRLTRLTTLSLANNPVSQISPNIANQLPNLRTLDLTGSQLRDLASLSPLFNLHKLEFLTLSSTALSQLPNYRTWIIHNLPSLRWLDYSKVKEHERTSAKKLYINASDGLPTELAQSMGAQSVQIAESTSAAKTFEVPGSTNGQAGKTKGLTDEQKLRVRKAIEKAGTLEEIQRLKRMLQDGFIPDERTVRALAGK